MNDQFSNKKRPTKTFKIVSRRNQYSWRRTMSCSILTAAILVILAATIIKLDAVNDANFPSYLVYFLMDFVGMEMWLEQEIVWLVSGAALGLLVFETMQGHGSDESFHDGELCLTLCPLGIQRYMVESGKKKHHPLLPTEAVKDCIVTEHVGAFCVTTHVMFRIYGGIPAKNTAGNLSQDSNISLVETFPNASLTFDQCYSLRNQIQATLDEIK